MKTLVILFALAVAATAFPHDGTGPSNMDKRDVLIPTPALGYPYAYEPYGYLKSYAYPYYYGTYLRYRRTLTDSSSGHRLQKRDSKQQQLLQHPNAKQCKDLQKFINGCKKNPSSQSQSLSSSCKQIEAIFKKCPRS